MVQNALELCSAVILASEPRATCANACRVSLRETLHDLSSLFQSNNGASISTGGHTTRGFRTACQLTGDCAMHRRISHADCRDSWRPHAIPSSACGPYLLDPSERSEQGTIKSPRALLMPYTATAGSARAQLASIHSSRDVNCMSRADPRFKLLRGCCSRTRCSRPMYAANRQARSRRHSLGGCCCCCCCCCNRAK
jgi:hypothetical protein